MHIKNKKSSRKVILFIVIIVLILAISATGFWWFSRNNDNDKNNSKKSQDSSQSNSDKKSDSNSPDKSNENSAKNPTIESEKSAPQNDQPTTNSESVKITAHTITDDSGNLIVDTIMIYPVLQNGICVLSIGDYSISSNINPAHNGPNYSVCDDFNIPANKLSVRNYKLEIKSASNSEILGTTKGNF